MTEIMTVVPPSRSARHLWERPVPPGEVLASLRRGLGRQAGGVPGMWRYYSTLDKDGRLTPRLAAEHVTLCLYGLHQQGRSDPVHAEGITLGRAARSLRESERFSAEAVDRRFTALATSATLGELEFHLRGLIQQLRSLPGSELDYTSLYFNLVNFQRPEGVSEVRRRWGAAYFVQTAAGTAAAAFPTTSQEPA